MPPKFRRELASKTFLAVGSVKTVPKFFANAFNGLPYSASSLCFLAFFSTSIAFYFSVRKTPRSGSLIANMVTTPSRAEMAAIIIYYALHPNIEIKSTEKEDTPTPK